MSIPDFSRQSSYRADEPHLAEEAALARLERVLKMVRMLQSGQRYTSGDLSNEFGVAKRTIFRDIKVLRDCGIPVDTGAKGDGYYLEGDVFLREAELTAREIGLILLGIHTARQLPSPARDGLLEGGLNKLLGSSSRSLDDRLAQFDQRVEIADVESLGSLPDVPWMAMLFEHLTASQPLYVWVSPCDSHCNGTLHPAPVRHQITPTKLSNVNGAWELATSEPSATIKLQDITMLEPVASIKLRR